MRPIFPTPGPRSKPLPFLPPDPGLPQDAHQQAAAYVLRVWIRDPKLYTAAFHVLVIATGYHFLKGRCPIKRESQFQGTKLVADSKHLSGVAILLQVVLQHSNHRVRVCAHAIDEPEDELRIIRCVHVHLPVFAFTLTFCRWSKNRCERFTGKRYPHRPWHTPPRVPHLPRNRFSGSILTLIHHAWRTCYFI